MAIDTDIIPLFLAGVAQSSTQAQSDQDIPDNFRKAGSQEISKSELKSF